MTIHQRCVNDLFGYCKAEVIPLLEKPTKSPRGDFLVGGICERTSSTCEDYVRFGEECPIVSKEKGWVA